MQYISDITVVHPKANDDEFVYAGGRLVISGKQISTFDLLNALGFDVTVRVCTDECIANRIPTRLGMLEFCDESPQEH